jgi:hypothetical protein
MVGRAKGEKNHKEIESSRLPEKEVIKGKKFKQNNWRRIC